MGASGDDTVATNAGSAYVYQINPAQSAELIHTIHHPTLEAGDTFGIAVAVSDNHVLVGANWDNTGAANTGSAYLFNFDSTTLELVDTFNNPTPESGDFFGDSVALASTHAVVGAYRDDSQNLDQGSAYIFDVGNQTSVALTSSVTTNVDTPTRFTASDFQYSDAEGNTLVSITISALSLADGDTLKLNDSDVTENQTIVVADLPHLIYTPAATQTGARSTFDFKANGPDSGNVAAKMNISVTPAPTVNDAREHYFVRRLTDKSFQLFDTAAHAQTSTTRPVNPL